MTRCTFLHKCNNKVGPGMVKSIGMITGEISKKSRNGEG